MKKFFYIFPLLLVISIIISYIVLSLTFRLLKAVLILSLTRLDLTLPLLFGSLFNTKAAFDVVMINFIILESCTSLSDILTISIFLFSTLSIALIVLFLKEHTYKPQSKIKSSISPEMPLLHNNLN